MSTESSLPPATPRLANLSGMRIGDYLLLRLLGRGGMADVYLAQQESLQRRVAFKVLRTDLSHDASYVRRFHNEAQSAAALVHAHIVQIHEVGCVDGLHFIVQEYVAGQNLREYLAGQGGCEVSQACSILVQVTAALARAHQGGIVHRDIKPENILLGDDGTVKVADFGLARMTHSPRSLELTEVGVTMGTPLYMSPEQIEGRALDTRSDIYSLGVTAYQMLAGRPPFTGETPLAIAVQHLRETPVALETLRADLPSSLCAVVAKMLAKRPADRFADPRALHAALLHLEIPTSATGEGGPQPTCDLSQANATHTTSRYAETVALAKTLHAYDHRPRWQPARRVAWWILGVLIGAWLAWTWLPGDPLALGDGESLPAIENKGSAEAQYIYAAMVDTEQAWQSVLTYFPPEAGHGGSRARYYALRAQQQLARLHMQNGEYEQALELLRQLADLEATEQEFRAFGLAGQAFVYNQRGQRSLAVDYFASAWSLREHLDPDTRDRLERLQQELAP